jgi:hypothetical protein
VIEFSFDIPDWFWPACFVCVPVAVAVFTLWPHSAEGRKRQVLRWANENLVALTPEIGAALETALARRRRAVGALAFLCTSVGAALALGRSPLGSGDPVVDGRTILILTWIAITLAQGLQVRHQWFPAGPTRSARVRSVTLSDYVPRPLRWSAWASAGVCLMGLAVVPVHARTPVATAPVVCVLIALVVAEWNGRRTAARPQPARDEAELYAQDAWRTEVARYGFQGIALGGGLATAYLDGAPPVAGTVLRASGVALMLASVVVAVIPARPIEWTRARLWPGLRPGETIGTVTP